MQDRSGRVLICPVACPSLSPGTRAFCRQVFITCYALFYALAVSLCFSRTRIIVVKHCFGPCANTKLVSAVSLDGRYLPSVNKMRFFINLLLAIAFAALSLAAPGRRLQTPMGGQMRRHRHSPNVGSAARPSVHVHSTGPQNHSPPKKFRLPYVVKTPSTPAASKYTRPSMPSWINNWRAPAAQQAGTSASAKKHEHMHAPSRPFANVGSADVSCFCAGGSICCHTHKGVDCNSGYCGI